MKFEIQFDEKEFRDYFIFATKLINNATVKGMHRAVKAWERDAKEVAPKVPVLSGWLRDHHRTEVLQGRDLIGVLETYDTPYAATVHSGISRHGTPITYGNADRGSQWISSKLYMFAERYFKIIQEELDK